MPREGAGRFGYYRDGVFLACLAAYLCNRLLIKPHLRHYSPFFDGHFNDCLLVPVALPIFLLIYRYLGLRPDDAPPRWWEIGWHLLVWSLFFKWFGPIVLHQSVADPVDVGCYFAGGAAAWFLWHYFSASAVRPAGQAIMTNERMIVVVRGRVDERQGEARPAL